MYDSLPPRDKVRAVLSTVQEPVTKDLLFELGEIDWEGLSEEERKSIDSVFEDDIVEKTLVNEETGYMISGAERQKVEKEIDVHSAHFQIANVLWKDLMGEELQR